MAPVEAAVFLVVGYILGAACTVALLFFVKQVLAPQNSAAVVPAEPEKASKDEDKVPIQEQFEALSGFQPGRVQGRRRGGDDE